MINKPKVKHTIKKFENVISADDYEILTPSGWSSIKNVMKTVPYKIWLIKTDSGRSLSCADTHILIDENDDEIYVQDLRLGTKIKTIDGIESIMFIGNYPTEENMYDIEIADNNHLYYSNGFISHNTTTVASYFLHQIVFQKDYRLAILANKGDTAREILDRVKKMFEELPWYLKPGVVEWNKGTIELSNGTVVMSAATSSSSIRGKTINLLYLDEMSFVRNDVDFFASTYPVITSGTTTKVIISSTPNGMNLFYKMWSDAINKRNNFIPKRVYWHEQPGRDEKWKEETIRNIGLARWLQEYECEFQGSANTLISSAKLQQLSNKEPILSDNTYFVYSDATAEHEYVICVDVAEGLGRDYSAVCIFDVSEKPFTQVAVYRNNLIPPIMFAEIVHKICKKYNNAFCIVESNGVGRIVSDMLYNDFEYENMLTSKETGGFNEYSSSGITGLRQTRKTKMIGASTLKSLIESDTLILNDFNTINELSTFIKTKSSYQAEPGKNDDICMTLLIFAWFSQQTFFEEITNANMRSIIKDNYSKMEDSNHLIFGFYDDGTEDDNTLLINNPRQTNNTRIINFR